MSDDVLQALRDVVGNRYVLTGADTAPYSRDWSDEYHWSPLAVVRPATTQDVSDVMKVAHACKIGVVPVAGRTGLTRATEAEGLLMLSLERLSTIRDIRADARIAIVEAGAVLSSIHDAVAEHGLIFPVTFGARGSALIGGVLATNAGGSNVVRYGNTRGLCLGIEAVLADGRILDLMSEVHKDNSGYDLRDLLIGSEGTLGIITAAVLKLAPRPHAYASAMVACPSISAALRLLNDLQSETGGAVEAFEYMPDNFIEAHLERYPQARPPFEEAYAVNIFVELGATSKQLAQPNDAGQTPITAQLEQVLETRFNAGDVLDAVIAKSEAERQAMWARRETSAELSRLHHPIIDNDICVPVDRMEVLIDRIERETRALDPHIRFLNVAHLGDGNLHFAAWPSTSDPALHAQMARAVEDAAVDLGGSFSAEHGVGVSKRGAMARLKDPAALQAMRAIKDALDPDGILNPGKVLPPCQ